MFGASVTSEDNFQVYYKNNAYGSVYLIPWRGGVLVFCRLSPFLQNRGDIKKCALDVMRDFVGKVQQAARKPQIRQEMIIKMDEQGKWKNVSNEE